MRKEWVVVLRLAGTKYAPYLVDTRGFVRLSFMPAFVTSFPCVSNVVGGAGDCGGCREGVSVGDYAVYSGGEGGTAAILASSFCGAACLGGCFLGGVNLSKRPQNVMGGRTRGSTTLTEAVDLVGELRGA